MVAEGKTVTGLLVIGMAVGENLPGGKAARGIISHHRRPDG
jgi:hypothetical protein